MNTLEKLLSVLSASILLIGIQITFRWTYNSKITGVVLILISLLILYLIYLKNRKTELYATKINTKHIGLGLLLILIDISYNLYTGDEFRSLDYGMLSAGAFIILLNLGIFRALKLDEKNIMFSTYFIFILTGAYSFIFAGIPILLNSPPETNPFLDYLSLIAIAISSYLLNFIKPTVNMDRTIDFDGYRVGIGNPCSGAESITIFLSSVAAYLITIREKKLKKIGLYAIIGAVALFFMNILRIMILVIVGYYFGNEKMLFTHYNLGWIMFALGMAVFWYLVIDDY